MRCWCNRWLFATASAWCRFGRPGTTAASIRRRSPKPTSGTCARRARRLRTSLLTITARRTLTSNGPVEKVTCMEVSAGFFRTLGVSPVLGRDFSYDEGGNGTGQRVVVLGNRFWRNRLGADPQILGKTLRVGDRVYTVVGVLPPGDPWIKINDQTYVPFGLRPNADRTSWEFDVIGRLRRGVSAETARGDLQRIAGVLAQSYPQ